MNGRLMPNGISRERLFAGSTPNLSAQSRQIGPRPLRKQHSMEAPKTRGPELGSVRLPSRATICRWKQVLTERLRKRQRMGFSKKKKVRLGSRHVR